VNTNELNKVLSDEIFKLRSGKAKPERVNAITRAASQIIAAARLELAYVKMAGVPQAILPFFNHHAKARVVSEQKKLAKK
jgi:hypothetical protein